jgi:alpha-amylase
MKMPSSIRRGLTLATLASLALATAQAATQQNQASSAILFQGFHWNSPNYSNGWYADLQSKAADLKAIGITHVWFPPPTDSADANGYLPRQLNVLDSHYGSEASLKNALLALKAQGIQAVADVVINHRVGTTNWADFTNPAWDCHAVAKGDEWSGACGNADTGDGYGSARDLDHTQASVQNGIKTWMTTRLKADGFTGIRYDFSKGYAPSYAKLYHDAVAPDFCVGEIWTNLDLNNVDAHRQILMNYIDGTGGACATFDFTTKGLLNQVLANNDYWRLKAANGAPQGGIGWWAQKMVTFVDNHDTGPSESCTTGQNLWPVPCDKVMQGYAYILTHPGIPTVYYPHVYNWNLKAPIATLISLRKEKGVTSTSGVSIQKAETGLYAAIVNGNLAMKIGPNSWSPGAGWTLRTSGTNYAVWTK